MHIFREDGWERCPGPFWLKRLRNCSWWLLLLALVSRLSVTSQVLQLAPSAAMAALEPSAPALAAMTTIEGVLDFVPIAGAFRAALLAMLEVEGTEPTRTLTNIDAADIDDMKATIKIGENHLGPANKVGTAWRIARLAVGLEKTAAKAGRGR